MERLKEVSYNDVLSRKDYLKTNYDDLFKDNIRYRGVNIYLQNKITDYKMIDNKVEAKVTGNNTYNVSVNYLDKNNIECYCDCPYHKDNIYCKHIYALLLYKNNKNIKEELITIYNNDLTKLKDINEKIPLLIKDYSKYLYKSQKEYMNNIYTKYNDFINDLENHYNDINITYLFNTANRSFIIVNDLIREYNYIVDHIEKQKDEKENKKEDKKEKNDTVTYTWHIGGDIFDTLDDIIADVPLPILKKARQMDIDNGEDTDILDKAIKERKRRDKIIRKEKAMLEREEKQMRRSVRRSIFFGLLGGLFSSNSTSSKNKYDETLMDWEEDLVNRGEYEPYNFEEENMEEEDFYYEDD